MSGVGAVIADAREYAHLVGQSERYAFRLVVGILPPAGSSEARVLRDRLRADFLAIYGYDPEAP